MIKQTLDSQDALREWMPQFINTFAEGGVFGLTGELGAGKTTLVREFIFQLAAQVNTPAPRVISPTYVFHQNHCLGKFRVEHFDLYRMADASERSLIEIGYYEAIERVQYGGFLFVEWPERASDRKLLQLDYLISINVTSATARHVTIAKL